MKGRGRRSHTSNCGRRWAWSVGAREYYESEISTQKWPLKKRPVIPEGRQEVKGKGHERNETKSVQGYGGAIHVVNCKISLKGVHVFNSITNKASHGGALSLVAI